MGEHKADVRANSRIPYKNSLPSNLYRQPLRQNRDCEERLIVQAAMVKAVNPDTKVFVYRNLVKALPWYTSVWTKLADPQYAGWFLKFSGANNYHVPQCDDTYSPPLCSDFYVRRRARADVQTPYRCTLTLPPVTPPCSP